MYGCFLRAEYCMIARGGTDMSQIQFSKLYSQKPGNVQQPSSAYNQQQGDGNCMSIRPVLSMLKVLEM